MSRLSRIPVGHGWRRLALIHWVFCSGPFLLSELGRSSEFTPTFFLNVFRHFVQTESLYSLAPLQIDAPHNFYVMPIPHLLLIGCFWKNSCARFLVAGFCITSHYFSTFPLNWVVDLHCRYWRMDCRHRCYFALISGLFCAMSVYVLYKFECSTGKHS